MRKLQKVAVVAAMLGGIGLLGAGTAQATNGDDSPVTVEVTQDCSATGGAGGGGGAGGDGTIGEGGDGGAGGAGGAATTVCSITIS